MSDNSADQFHEACGATQPLRLIVEHFGLTTEHAFRQPFAFVGRNPRANLHFDDQRLANCHAYFQLVAGRLLFVNFMYHVETHRAGWLDPGQTIEFGPIRIGLHENAPSANWFDADSNRPYPRNGSPSILLDVQRRGGARATWRMRRPMALIGRSSVCRIRLDDPDVSRFHCGLVKTPTGLWAVDLLSRNGIAINKESVCVGRLDEGAQLSVGEFTFDVRHDELRSDSSRPKPMASVAPGFFAGLRAGAPITGLPMLSAPANAAGADGAEHAISPLVLQLAQMQQQMMGQMQQQLADQFQQAMGLFVEAFWSMHREQAQLVRRELKRIRGLTREMARLQAHLTPNLAAPAAALADAPTEKSAPKQKVVADVPKAAIPRAPTPSTPPEPKKPFVPFPQSPAAMGQSPADMHAWLNQRVADIQRQRQSSWQRLLNLLQGKTPPGEPAPQSSSTKASV